MISYIIWAIVLYVLFRFTFNFVIPVIRAGKQMRRQMNDFHEKMNQQQQQSQFQQQTQADSFQSNSTKAKKKAEDYIDFEEIRD